MTINTILFDLDGVLVDSQEIHRVTLNEALDAVSGITIEECDYRENFIHLYTTQKIQKLVDRGLVSLSDIDDIYALKQAKTSIALKKDLITSSQSLALVEFLQQNKYNVGCVTGAIRKSANIMLYKSGTLSFMDLIITRDDVKKTKPNPEPYLKAMQLFKVAPYQCMIVEDEEKGIVSAIMSGCNNIWKINHIDEVSIDNFRRQDGI